MFLPKTSGNADPIDRPEEDGTNHVGMARLYTIAMSKAPVAPSEKKNIRVIIVDDIPETRENLKKLLAFESDIEVIGTASTGREGVDLARDKKPDVILMDINMPDMDGIQATELINKTLPTAGIVMMSVQSEPDYLRRAMLAGARDFLTKPIAGDELYATVRRVYELTPKMMPQQVNYQQGPATGGPGQSFNASARTGFVIVVYSPQGGAGKTTIATNLAAALMREGTKVLLIDCDLQFGDVGVFLNLTNQSTIVSLVKSAFDEDLDLDLMENVLVKHDSGLKVLLAPSSPQEAENVPVDGTIALVSKLRSQFDYTIIDTSTELDDLNLGLFDLADRVLLIANATLPAVKNTRLILTLMDSLGYPEAKTPLIFNKVNIDFERNKITPPVAKVEANLKRTAILSIPADERRVMASLTRGTPVIATKERTVSPVKEFIMLADMMRASLTPAVTEVAVEAVKASSGSRLSRLFGNS